MQLIWQTGNLYIDEYNKHNELSGINTFAFLNRMDLAYAAADFIISRSGASSVSELCVVGKPVIFIPSPNVSEDHQTKNARSLVNNEAALMVTDAQANQNLVKESIQLLANKEKLQELSNNIEKLAKENSATIIAKEVLA